MSRLVPVSSWNDVGQECGQFVCVCDATVLLCVWRWLPCALPLPVPTLV